MRSFYYVVPVFLLFLSSCQNAGVSDALNQGSIAGSRFGVSDEVTGSVAPVAANSGAADFMEDAKGNKTIIEHYSPPTVGTIFGWRNNWASLEEKLVYRVATLGEKFEGRSVMRFDSIEGTGNGTKSYFDLHSANLVGHHNKLGVPLVTYQKIENRLKFPMRSGEKWTANWKFLDHKSNKTQSGGGEVTAIGIETLNTDAGAFKTMKIRLPLPANAGRGMHHHIWFAPRLGVVVREQISNNRFSWIKEIERVELPKG